MINLERKLNETSDRSSNETMKNGSNQDRIEFLQKSWILAEVISVLIVCACVWCLTALLRHRAQRAKVNGGNNKIITMINMALIVPIMTIMSCLSTQVVIISGLMSETNTTSGDHACEVADDLSLYMYSLAIPPTYFFLWYRMRMIYTQPTMRYLDTAVVKFFSHALIVLLLFGGSFATIKASIPHSYAMAEVGCVNVAKKAHDYTSNFIAAGTLVSSQLILFGLFLHPLLHHRYKAAHSLSKKSRDGTKTLLAAIRMATISTAICLFSDTFALMLVVLAMPSDSPKLLDRTVYDLSLLLNLLSVILCFKHYKRIMLGLKPVPVIRKLTAYRSNNLVPPTTPTSPSSFASSFF